MIVNFLELCRAEWNNFLLQVYISFQLISQQSLCWRDCTATSLSLYNTYQLNSKQKHKFLVTHLISTPHKLFHISRESILEESTRLHEILQCPEGYFTRLGPFPYWKCLIKTDVVRAFSGQRKIYRSPFDTSTYCLSEKMYLNENYNWKCEWPNFPPSYFQT